MIHFPPGYNFDNSATIFHNYQIDYNQLLWKSETFNKIFTGQFVQMFSKVITTYLTTNHLKTGKIVQGTYLYLELFNFIIGF